MLPGGSVVLSGDGRGLQGLPDQGRSVGAGGGVGNGGGGGVDGLVVLVRITILVQEVVIVTRERDIIKIIVVRVTVGLISNVAVIICTIIAAFNFSTYFCNGLLLFKARVHGLFTGLWGPDPLIIDLKKSCNLSAHPYPLYEYFTFSVDSMCVSLIF